MNLCSDNVSGVHPKIMDALIKADADDAMAYGNDRFTHELEQLVRAKFQHETAEIWPVATGTAANAIGLGALTPAFGSVYCHKLSHLEVDECGAPVFYTGGASLIHVDYDPDALITIKGLKQELAKGWRGVVHHTQPAVLSLTQLSEMGTHYSLETIKTLSDMAHEAGMMVHMDGARFSNALCVLGCTPAEMSWKAGIDLLSFGATKNGAMAAELIISFTPAATANLGFMRKRGGHLFSKMRYLSAQLIAYLQDDLFLENASHANQMAQYLAHRLTDSSIRLAHGASTKANMIFAYLSPASMANARAAGHEFYDYPAIGSIKDALGQELLGVRLVTSWNSHKSDIDDFIRSL